MVQMQNKIENVVLIKHGRNKMHLNSGPKILLNFFLFLAIVHA